jgi:hypothetical protein
MNSQLIRKTFDEGKGIFLMCPNWIPRALLEPGKRLRLLADDYSRLGLKRGYICERWFSATEKAETGPEAPEDEGLSYIYSNGTRLLFKDCVAVLGSDLIGREIWEQYHRWPVFSKFFDYKCTSFHHLHHKEKDAALVGLQSKPEAYYYPAEMNLSLDSAPVTYFGFDPSVTKEEIIGRLSQFENHENRLTELSRAFRLELGTGWYTPPGVLHACGSLCTYEPQWMSESCSLWENHTPGGSIVPYDEFAGKVPENKRRDLEYLYNLMDIEANFDPDYRKKYFRRPVIEIEDKYYTQKWITYGNPFFAAKELRIQPGQTVVVKDNAAYGCILIQGHGRFGVFQAEAPNVIRFGEQTYDEFFVSERSAREGVRIENNSHQEFVMLKHFCHNVNAPSGN